MLKPALVPFHLGVVMLRAADITGVDAVFGDATAACLEIGITFAEITRHIRHRQAGITPDRLYRQTRGGEHRIGLINVLLHEQSQTFGNRFHLDGMVLYLQFGLAQLCSRTLLRFMTNRHTTRHILHTRDSLQHRRGHQNNPYTRMTLLHLNHHLYSDKPTVSAMT